MTYNRYPRPKPRKSRTDLLVPALGGLSFLIVGGLVVMAVSMDYQNSQTQTCTVISKDRSTKIVDGNSAGSDMRVYTEQCGTLAVSDLLFAGEVNSADLFAKIKPETTYEIETTGYRIGLLSSFPIIRSIAEVTP